MRKERQRGEKSKREGGEERKESDRGEERTESNETERRESPLRVGRKRGEARPLKSQNQITTAASKLPRNITIR